MVRNYKRKTIRSNFSEQSMFLAIDSIKFKKMFLKKASVTFNINKDALHRRIQIKLKNLDSNNIYLRSLGSLKKRIAR